MKKVIIFLALIIICNSAFAQTPQLNEITGVVYSLSNGKKEPIPFASVYWLQAGTFVDSDVDGKFIFTAMDKMEATLVATAIGYTRDTIELNNDIKHLEFVLKGTNELEQAVVIGRQEGNYLSKLAPVRTEVITAAGLCKMACCNLAESFENSASVTVGYSDAITGARQIRLLGLSGVYNQMLDENRPVMRGLASPFGLSYVPGQWLESIQIAKGPSSVINGVEAITGQINLEHRKPTTEEPFFLNLFLSSHLRTEANVASSLQLNDNWSTVLLGHYSIDPKSHDGNKDGFRDGPETQQFNFANRWLYSADNGIQVRFGFRALSDDRLGGEMAAERGKRNNTEVWGSNILNKGVNAYVKLGVPLNKENTRSLAVVADYTYHELDSYFGLNNYGGKQNSSFVNLMYQDMFSESHRFTLGLRNQFDDFVEGLSSINSNNYNLDRRENSFGVYGEYTYTLGDKFTAVGDLSLDYNNIHGILFSPRLNLKYTFADFLVFRASGGRGFRSANAIADNLGILSTGRDIVIDSNLDIEEAWTYGGNLTAYLPIGLNDKTYFSFDYFRNDFISQLIVDQERDLSKAWLYNLDGPSYTNTYQVDFSIEAFERFTVMATFRYTDAKVTLEGKGLVERPLTSKYKGVLNLQYATNMNLWTFDFTAQMNGPSRLPNYMDSETGYSPAYPMLFLQVTRRFKGLEIYVGGENLTNYKQPNPIISADNPFSQDFNASAIWGPIMGIKAYVGLRFTLGKS